ncbi:hypothetical protein ACF1HJ_36955 [Streptomyces sp. NPDC013978]|uniref:hypothetical protein n=1 Tax=Streptomyces sp. NPDC013978 TaxID=3364869 RepID=UPI0036F4CB05
MRSTAGRYRPTANEPVGRGGPGVRAAEGGDGGGGGRPLVVLAEEDTATEVVDELHDRLCRQTGRAAHLRDRDRRTGSTPVARRSRRRWSEAPHTAR